MSITPSALLKSKKELATLLEKAMSTKNEVQLMSATRALYLLVDQVQQQLACAHTTVSTLLKENEHLQESLSRLKEWAQEKDGYALHSLPAGTFVYRLKSLTERAVADHYLCVRCYQSQVKSIMQPGANNFLACPTCQSSIQILPPLAARA
ncbi:hypothetical protein [Pseudomonas zeae]|uniref:hypothetical protein n=1 Tax=Pseudomonas zeae TaxID=2745510 RepID=UPI0039E166EE